VKIVLFDWAPSPFCMKVRAVLARKGLPYERVPALGRVREVRRRGGVGKAPALEIDGELHVDSTDIVYALEARAPTPSVLPEDTRERAMCHALEDWADEALYFLGLYFHWHEPQGRKQARRYFGRTALGRVLFWPYAARIERQLFGQGTGRKSEAHVRRDLERSLDAVEAMLEGRDYLLGDGPYLCDYAVASQLTYLTRAPATRTALAERPRTQALLARLPDVRM
jgi:glutathione S-transferase